MESLNWSEERILNLFSQPLFTLVTQAYACHQQHHDVQDIEYCMLANIKTGACPEDCAYCPQSGHYNTGLAREKLSDLSVVEQQVQAAITAGAKRLCLGAAWRNPPAKDFPKILAMVRMVKDRGLECCVTLGMLTTEQAQALKTAGLDYYNHNLDTSPEFYSKIITTRTYQDRIDTLTKVAEAGIGTCCGGILGMGETRQDRARLLLALYRLPTPPKSIPLNKLIPIPGTPLAQAEPIDMFELVKTIAIARLMFPDAKIRLAAGRESMSDPWQAWCFFAGVNSIFIGDKLLTANNQTMTQDRALLTSLGFEPPKISPATSCKPTTSINN